jgi:aspartate carbamoyltransferase catalytic subunit
MKHLLTTEGMQRSHIESLLDVADHMAEVNNRAVPKVPALRGKIIASVFFEDSTRTRLSFETAAKRLSADVLTFSAASSSVNKGESIRDTVETLSAMGVDAFVVRHRSSGVAQSLTTWTEASIINAGDGWHQHPTQALLDAYTITRERARANVSANHSKNVSDLSGVRIAIVGDILHSRVARSTSQVLSQLGASVTFVSPATLLPSDLSQWNVSTAANLDEVIDNCDVLYMLRMQKERMNTAFIPDVSDYCQRFALTENRARRLRDDALLMHPGPMNRDIEMAVDPSGLTQSRILQQVTNGISVRMAVLFSLLGSGADASLSQGNDV